jgi:putative endonuclease
MFTVYILYSEFFDSFYIGYSSDMDRRINEHNEGLTQSTKAKRPWKTAYTEQLPDLKSAVARERFLKNQKNKSFYKRISGMI